jgi:hypothetical protein
MSEKRQLTYSGLHSIISQKTELLTNLAWSPTLCLRIIKTEAAISSRKLVITYMTAWCCKSDEYILK